MSNSYNENLKNKTINEKFLAYCFLRLNEKNEIVENIVDQKSFNKIILLNRGVVATVNIEINFGQFMIQSFIYNNSCKISMMVY